MKSKGFIIYIFLLILLLFALITLTLKSINLNINSLKMQSITDTDKFKIEDTIDRLNEEIKKDTSEKVLDNLKFNKYNLTNIELRYINKLNNVQIDTLNQYELHLFRLRYKNNNLNYYSLILKKTDNEFILERILN